MNGATAPDPLDDLDDVIHELEGSEWDEEITETNITVEKGATVVITGKHQAVSEEQAAAVTKPDNEKPDTQPPPSKVSPVTVVFVAVRKMPPWGVVLVALAGIAAYVALKR
jgi:hypothetical protein